MAHVGVIRNRQPRLPPWLRAVGVGVILVGLVALLDVTGAIALVSRTISGGSTPTYQTATVGRGDVKVTVSATGPISAADSVPLSFKESGKLTAIKVSVGDHVTQGQVLATLDTSDLKVSLEQAQATLAQQQANLAKVQAGSTAQAITVAQTTVDNAKQSVADAKASLADTQTTNAQNVAAAVASLATAQTNLDNAQASLAATEAQAAKTIAVDQLSITNAQKTLATAQDQEVKGLAADLKLPRFRGQGRTTRRAVDDHTPSRTRRG